MYLMCFNNYTKDTCLSEEYALCLHFIVKLKIKKSLIPFNKLGGATYANFFTNVTRVYVVRCTWVTAKTIERFIRELDVQFSK